MKCQLGLVREREDSQGRKENRVMETGIRGHSRSKHESAMLKGVMIRIQTTHWTSNKEANRDLSRIILVA